jgi:putative methyltransferase (TIGR04325 family)
MGLKDIVKQITPPVLHSLAKRLYYSYSTKTYGLTASYSSWEQAVVDSSGYDAQNILEKTKQALLKVKNHEAVYERDSVLFDQVEYSWSLLAGLMWVAARHGGTLNVLDFGGSLGSTYYQNRQFLATLNKVRWNIVEQPHYVETGKACFENNSLRFYPNITACLEENRPDIIILSSVLQYLESPYTILNQIMEVPADLILIDRTPFWSGKEDRVFIQRVPPEIYTARYPIWVFSMERFYSTIQDGWKVLTTFDNPTDKLNGPIEFSYQGAFIVRKEGMGSL